MFQAVYTGTKTYGVLCFFACVDIVHNMKLFFIHLAYMWENRRGGVISFYYWRYFCFQTNSEKNPYNFFHRLIWHTLKVPRQNWIYWWYINLYDGHFYDGTYGILSQKSSVLSLKSICERVRYWWLYFENVQEGYMFLVNLFPF